MRIVKRKKIFRVFSLLAQNFGAYKPQILILTGLGLLSGILEGIGANALIPLFSLIIGETGENTDFISRMLREMFARFHVDFSLKYILIFVAALFIFKAIMLFIGNYIESKISSDYEKNTRTELFLKVMRSQWRFLLYQKIGYLEKVISVEVGVVAKLFLTISNIILILTGLLMYIVVAVNISFLITIVTMASGVILLVIARPLILKIKQLRMGIAVMHRQVAHFINENMLGIKTLKIFSVKRQVGVLGERHFKDLRNLQVRYLLTANILGSFTQPFSVIFILLVFSFSYKTANFSLPSFIAIIYLIQRIFTYIQNLQAHLQTVYGFVPYLENLSRYRRSFDEQAERNNLGRPFVFEKSLEFNDVSFSYGEDTTMLNHVAFRVGNKECIGVAGHSGSGKTTIADLILGLFEPQSGTIMFDGVSILDINLDEVRRNIGYVSQDVFILNDSIANNIRFYDPVVSEEEIIRAAKKAHIYDFANGLPQKFDTIVGERGVLVSAGQRQRIAIARVLVRSPRLLILDEATSSLDKESEREIQKAIDLLRSEMAVIIIAHRLSTIVGCDKIIVMEKGSILEQGVPKDLLDDPSSYFSQMYTIRE